MNIERVDGYEKICQVECFEKEFKKTTSEKNNNCRYHKWLRTQLYVLEAQGKEALKLEGFEHLNNTNPNLYSIRYPRSKKNPRVIYIYVDDNMVYLLHAFRETKKSDYDMAIKTAQKRAKLFV
ncbi:MAG: type II toxin-antitoxin system RelE/ParE family toxin [Clostridia bacterium]|nr:type II toxin-antitoxin system RelE/ParE family toxin [Clostridia bacterium]